MRQYDQPSLGMLWYARLCCTPPHCHMVRDADAENIIICETLDGVVSDIGRASTLELYGLVNLRYLLGERDCMIAV